ncbi:MAG: 3'-5' exonuclease [Candidatus Accumulibacter sp.]|jgi:predicted PolB exonuclease-like 3'-5' exonuclease|nr:3'-5' exonuclease [Accumulibacter sp.]
MTPFLVFDIETIPDIDGIRRIHDLDPALPETEVAEFAFQKQRAKNGSDFLPQYLHRVIVISCALRTARDLRVWSLAEPEQSEGEIVQRFFDGVEKFTPRLVSWNGGGFDLSTLHYRGLIHGVQASRYWDMGEGSHNDSREFKWNNYINRYHARHLDLMDLLALYQIRASAPLDELAKLIGFPGKLGMDGGKVWDAWVRGEISEIRDYCETDVMNTLLIFLRFCLMRGEITRNEYDEEIRFVKSELARTGKRHWEEFLAAWGSGDGRQSA